MLYVPRVQADGFRYYGQWAGNKEGTREDKICCVYEVWAPDRWHAYQCSRKRGHGPDGLYCKQHAKMVEVKG